MARLPSLLLLVKGVVCVALVVSAAFLWTTVALAQAGRLEVVPEAKENRVVLFRGQSSTVTIRVRNGGDADLPIKELQFGYAADSVNKPGPDFARPTLVGLDGITLPKGASTNVAAVFPAYVNIAEYSGQLYVTAQAQGSMPQLFYTFPIQVVEPSAKTWSAVASGWIALLLAALVLVLTIFIRGKDRLNFFQSPDKDYSVSRFQVWFWTEIVLFSYAYLFFSKGPNILFPDSIWGLLGISVGSITVATTIGVKNEEAAKAAGKTRATTPDLGPIRSMLSDDGQPSVMRLQMFAWTLAAGVFFLRHMYATGALWDVPSNLLILMGISHGGYLIDKSVKKP